MLESKTTCYHDFCFPGFYDEIVSEPWCDVWMREWRIECMLEKIDYCIDDDMLVSEMEISDESGDEDSPIWSGARRVSGNWT